MIPQTPLDIFYFSTLNFQDAIHPPVQHVLRETSKEKAASFLLVHFTSTRSSVFEVLV